MGAFVDFERTKGGLVPTLRVLLRSSVSLRLWAAFHDLNRHVTVACEDEQPGRVGLLNFPVWTWRFERDQSPRSDKPCPDALIPTAILAARQPRACHTHNQSPQPYRNQIFTS